MEWHERPACLPKSTKHVLQKGYYSEGGRKENSGAKLTLRGMRRRTVQPRIAVTEILPNIEERSIGMTTKRNRFGVGPGYVLLSSNSFLAGLSRKTKKPSESAFGPHPPPSRRTHPHPPIDRGLADEGVNPSLRTRLPQWRESRSRPTRQNRRSRPAAHDYLGTYFTF